MLAICNNSHTYSYVQDEFLCPGWIYKMYAISNMIFLCPGWIYKTLVLCDIALVYSYVQHDFYVEDGSMKLLLYVILHLFIFMSNMIFFVEDGSAQIFFISYSTCYSYVKDESTKWLLYVKLHIFFLMSNMRFLCPGWIYEMYVICNKIFLCPKCFL